MKENMLITVLVLDFAKTFYKESNLISRLATNCQKVPNYFLIWPPYQTFETIEDDLVSLHRIKVFWILNLKNDVILLSTREQTLFINFDFLYLKTPLERLGDFSISGEFPKRNSKQKQKKMRDKNNSLHQVAGQITWKQG